MAAYQLVSYDERKQKFQLRSSALRAIEELPAPMQVLSAVGDARIGKSTFLNMVFHHWDQTSPHGGAMPFDVGSTTQACTRGVWLRIRRLPEGGSLVLVDVEGNQLGNDAVTGQLSALTAVLSSCILLFVREVVNNAALQFLYHTTKLGKMFPDSEGFPRLEVAIRDPLDLNPQFPSRCAEVIHSVTDPTHDDGNDEVRREIAAVFPPKRISASEVKYQERQQLKNLQSLRTGPYFESTQVMIAALKKHVPAKLTPKGMEMNGEDLVEMIQRLFTALENGDIATLESAYERLEKQMCEKYYQKWIEPLLSMSDDEFMSRDTQAFEAFAKQCKIDSFVDRVKREIETKRAGIIQAREAREEQRKADEELRRQQALREAADIARQRAEEAQRKAEQERLANMIQRIELGSGNLKGSGIWGKKRDYTYGVPDGAIFVSLSHEDRSPDSQNFGDGNGNVSLNWDKSAKEARVHAWVNGALGGSNEMRWTVYAWIKG